VARTGAVHRLRSHGGRAAVSGCGRAVLSSQRAPASQPLAPEAAVAPDFFSWIRLGARPQPRELPKPFWPPARLLAPRVQSSTKRNTLGWVTFRAMKVVPLSTVDKTLPAHQASLEGCFAGVLHRSGPSPWCKSASDGVAALDVGETEAEAFWRSFLRGLVARGLNGVKLVVSEAHARPQKAIAQVLVGRGAPLGHQSCRTQAS
jgi:Transposase, Mutator family